MRQPLAAVLLPLLTLAGLSPAARAAAPPAPFLVADLNHLAIESDGLPPSLGNRPGFGTQPVAMGKILYFAATDPAHGRELWRSDGTTAGTWRVSDIRPGPAGSNPNTLTVFKGRLYFVADDGFHGLEPWSSDGTAAGTLPLGDVCPGPCSSQIDSLSSLVPSGGRLFFTVESNGFHSLWVTDGTREGTREVPGPFPSGSQLIYQMVPLPHGAVLYSVFSATNGGELWHSDGTAGGTYRVPVPGGPTGLITHLFPFGNGAVFWLSDSLWRSDGTVAGTVRLRQGQDFDDSPAALVVQDGRLYFASFRNEIWVTDGTPQGTSLVAARLSHPALTASPCGPLFLASDSFGAIRLWRIHGTTGQTEPVSPTLGSSIDDLVDPWSAGGRAFFAVADSGSGSSDLWELDGVSCQSRRVTELCGASLACNAAEPYLTAAAGDTGFFVLSTRSEGAQLWRSDGSAAGTFQVSDIGRDPGSAGISTLAALGGQVLFSARTGAGPARLWRSDGTAAGTAAVLGVPWPQGLTAAGSFLYFTAGSPDPACFFNASPCRGLWRTDGTRAGTRLLRADVYYPRALAVDGDRLFFSARDNPDIFQGTGIEPWASDGTAAGTRPLLNINQQLYPTPVTTQPIEGSSDPGPAVRGGAGFLFAADDGLSGRELWTTDLTAGGTRQVIDLDPRGTGTELAAGSAPGPLVPLGGGFLFAADDGTRGRELWATDGTAAGTRLVADLLPGPDGSSPHDLTLLGSRVYFLAADPQNGGSEALWVSDGTAAGTRLVAPLFFRGAPSQGRSLTAAGGRLFLVVDNGAVGSELWTSDGTAAGTRLVRDLRPGPRGSYPQELTAVDGRLVFAADDGASGLEPWVSDGTATGTRRLGDLAPGADASSPGPFVAAGSYVFFGAWDPVHGRELWAVPRAVLGAP